VIVYRSMSRHKAKAAGAFRRADPAFMRTCARGISRNSEEIDGAGTSCRWTIWTPMARPALELVHASEDQAQLWSADNTADDRNDYRHYSRVHPLR